MEKHFNLYRTVAQTQQTNSNEIINVYGDWYDEQPKLEDGETLEKKRFYMIKKSYNPLAEKDNIIIASCFDDEKTYKIYAPTDDKDLSYKIDEELNFLILTTVGRKNAFNDEIYEDLNSLKRDIRDDVELDRETLDKMSFEELKQYLNDTYEDDILKVAKYSIPFEDDYYKKKTWQKGDGIICSGLEDDVIDYYIYNNIDIATRGIFAVYGFCGNLQGWCYNLPDEINQMLRDIKEQEEEERRYENAEKITGKELMEHCILQNCETDYDGNIEYYAHLDELLDEQYADVVEKWVFGRSCVLDYLYDNKFSEEEQLRYNENEKRLKELQEKNRFHLSQEEEEEIKELKQYFKNGWYEGYDFEDWEHDGNEDLVDFFEEWAKEIQEKILKNEY